MKLLRDLVICAQHRNRPGRFQADLGKEIREVARKPVLGFFRVTDLVVTQLELAFR
nr:hypothetical protein [Microbacterium sp. 18062]